MSKIKRIAVFCASSLGFESKYKLEAERLGQQIALRQKGIVYGGANIGLMGAVADSAMSSGGEVIGVIPAFLKKKELEHNSISQLIVVDSMHERKTKMNELCDAVIALPGGFGTLEELFEMLTWGQLALHTKPIGLLNIDGYYDLLSKFIDQMVEKGFLKKDYKDLLIIDSNIESLLDRLESYIPKQNNKWHETQ